MLRSRLAKLSKWKGDRPLAAERADLMPNHAIRMVANDRKRFWPMVSKKPRFWVSRVLMAWKMNCRKSVCTAVGSFDAGRRSAHAYGMRKFCSELVIVPVTWDMLVARPASRPISMLIAFE